MTKEDIASVLEGYKRISECAQNLEIFEKMSEKGKGWTRIILLETARIADLLPKIDKTL